MIRSGQKRDLFSGDNIATTGYTYSDWVSTKYDSLAVQAQVATLVASWITLRVEGRYDSNSREASVYAERFTSTHRIAEIVNVTADYGEVRVGANASPHIASPNNLYCSLVLYDVK